MGYVTPANCLHFLSSTLTLSLTLILFLTHPYPLPFTVTLTLILYPYLLTFIDTLTLIRSKVPLWSGCGATRRRKTYYSTSRNKWKLTLCWGGGGVSCHRPAKWKTPPPSIRDERVPPPPNGNIPGVLVHGGGDPKLKQNTSSMYGWVRGARLSDSFAMLEGETMRHGPPSHLTALRGGTFVGGGNAVIPICGTARVLRCS